MEEKKRKNVANEIQDTHSEFLDTLGEGLSVDFKRIIDVVAAIRNINKIEKNSLSKATIKEATKDRRIRQVLESYDVIDEFENSEAEKVAKQKEEATELQEKVHGNLDTVVEYLEKCRAEGKNVFRIFNGKKLYSADVTLDSAYLEVTGTTKEELVPLQEEFRNAKTDAEKRAVNRKWEALKLQHIQEKMNAQKEVEENAAEVQGESVEPEKSEDEKRALRAAKYDEKKNKYTMNKEKTLGSLSNNIEALLKKVQAAKKENSKGKKRGQDFEKENIYYDDLINILKSHRTYVRGQVKQTLKNNENKELEENSESVIVEDEKTENSIFEMESVEDEKIPGIVINPSEKGDEAPIEKSHFKYVPDEEVVDGDSSHFEPVSQEEEQNGDETIVISSPAQEYEAEKSYFVKDIEEEVEQENLAPEEKTVEKPKVKVAVARKVRGKVPEGQHIWVKPKEEKQNISEDFEWTYSEGEVNSQPIYEEMTYSEGEGDIEQTDAVQEPKTEVQSEPLNEPEQATETVVVEEKDDNTEKQVEVEPTIQETPIVQPKTVQRPKTSHTVEYIQVPTQTVVKQQEPKDVRDVETQDKESEGENVQSDVEPVTQSTPAEKEPSSAQNETGDAMQQLDNWAGAIIAATNNGKKVEDILKENTSTNSIVEKIEKGEISINDAKGVLAKKLRELGKSDKKLIATVEKYLLQRTNRGKESVEQTEKSLQKMGLWTRIRNAFKNFIGKISGKNNSKDSKDKADVAPAKNETNTNNAKGADSIENQYPKGAVKNITIGNIVIGDKGPAKANTLVTLNEGKKSERTIRYYGGTDMELEIVKDERTKEDDGEER